MGESLSAAGIESLSPAKRAALEKLLLTRRDAQAAADRIPRADPAAAAALSFAEQRLWLLDKLEPNHPFYNMPLAARVTGPLDRTALSESLRRLCDRHETLRYAYDMVDGSPVRRVGDKTSMEPVFVDLRGESITGGQLQERLREEARRPFDLSSPPLLRCVVLELSDSERVILLAMHHIVSDGWSMWVMLNELAIGYDAALRAQASPLQPLAVQYSDYAVWQRDCLAGDRREELIAYWKSEFANAPPILELPLDRPRPVVQDFDGAVHAFTLPEAVGKQLATRADESGGTPYMLLMAAYQTWLSRITGQHDLMVGTVVANRGRAELESLIGFFVNTLAVRGDLSDDPTFRDFCQQIHAKSIDAFAHQDLPFDQLIEAVAPERDQSHAALFQTALVVQNPPRDFARGQGVTIEPVLVDNGTAKYDLTLFFYEDQGRWTGQIEYRTSLFDASTIDRFARTFQTLISDALLNPDKPVSRLELLDEQERERLTAFNRSERTYTGPSTVHGLFEHSANRRPRHPAIVADDCTLTYAQLSERVCQMAAGLQAAGVRPGDPVVMHLPRSIDSVTALLAILGAGGVYVPVACDAAPHRLEFVIEDTGARLLISPSEHKNLGDVASLTPEQIRLRGASQSFQTQAVKPDSLAYTIYTSGSTGVPKGVQVEHGSFVNFMHAQLEVLGVTQDDRILHGMSPAFDAALSEAVIPLAAGATMVIASHETVFDPQRFNDLIDSQRVTLAKFPPAVLATLDPGRLTSLKSVSTGGDTLTTELANRWLPGRRMFNAYGPTEATVGVTIHNIKSPLTSLPPIGRPMGNMRAYVLDRHDQLVPIGVAGEICIGGVGVARGYLNRPDETAMRFVADPFSDDPNARMYRTGDIGRWRADGELEFLGRDDDQVQLRGYRVEPGEVAAALERLPQIDQAFVTVRADECDSQRLVAYVTVQRDKSGDAQGEGNHVAAWQSLMDGTHRAAGALRDTEFDTTGWISSFTGMPIPKEEMQLWAESVAAGVLKHKPRHVLEIGCGTGLILLQVAPCCESYVGADFLQRSLDQLQKVVDKRKGLSNLVELRQLVADQVDQLAGRKFDMIVMNSVAQYFPNSDYLLRVLRQASELLTPNGRMYLGDLRNLRLHEAFAAAVELTRGDARLSRRELLGRVEAQLRREEELLIDPSLFDALYDELPGLSRAEVQLKPGGAANELTRFRYDVVLHFGEQPSDQAPEVVLNDAQQPITLEQVEQELAASPKSVLIAGVRNPRVARDVEAWQQLSSEDGDPDVSSMKTHAKQADAAADPDCWRELANKHGYHAEVRWSDDPAACNVLLYRNQPPAWPASGRADRGFALLTNQPMQQKLLARLAPELRDGLAEHLPQYMLPSAFVVLDELPKNSNGKIDRDALPPPPTGRPAWATGYIAPRDEHEQLIAEVWEQLLGVSPVGAEDNFFELGGHSMLAVQVMAEIEARAGQAIPLTSLFQDPTVQNLAAMLRDPAAEQNATTLVPLQGTGDNAPLYCIHPAGGAVFCYQALAAHFAGQRHVIGIQARGVDGIRDAHETMEEMAQAYADAIRARQPEGPYHLCGWSLGGNIAYETARRLAEQGGKVGLIGLLDAGAIPTDESIQEEDLLPLLEALFPDTDHATMAEIREMSPDEQVQFFTDRAAQAGLVDPAQLAASQHIFAVFQNNVSAVHKHKSLPYDGPVVLFRAGEQTKTNKLFDDAHLGWGPLVKQVRVLEVPSDHNQMMNPPQVDTLAEMLKLEIAEAEAR